MYPRTCTMCALLFYSEAAFYNHYVQEMGKDTRCMSVEEMSAFGFQQKLDGYETWGDKYRDSWDPDRFIWGALYKPAEVFGDYFPAIQLPESSRRTRLLNWAIYGKLTELKAAWKGTSLLREELPWDDSMMRRA